MAWVKRNLFFLIGSVIALALLGAAGFYLFTKNKQNTELSAKLDAEYAELNRLNAQNPHPGNAKVDNIRAARDQQKRLSDFTDRAKRFFEKIPPIPNPHGDYGLTDQDSHEFASTLRDTIKQMQRDAAAASVTLPPNYDFSFSTIKKQITFASGSLQPLAVQLGEVKAICDILFHAKINSLDGIRRERVSADDKEMADYTDSRSVANELAVLTPYEVTFHGFSSELAGVLSGLAASPCGFIVKELNVDATGAPVVALGYTGSGASGVAPPPYVPPAYVSPQSVPGNSGDVASSIEQMRLRMSGGLAAYTPTAVTSASVPPPVAVNPPGRGGLQTVLNERLLKINLVIELVKLKKAAR
jgi:hypothetical protein